MYLLIIFYVSKDENDVIPSFSMQRFNASIFEDALPNFAVIEITAMDDDSGEFGRLNYTISDVFGSGGVNGTFVIDNATGIVRTAGTFDRETFAGPYIIIVS